MLFSSNKIVRPLLDTVTANKFMKVLDSLSVEGP